MKNYFSSLNWASSLLPTMLFTLMLTTSCSSEDNEIPDSPPEQKLPKACFTDTIRYEKAKATVYNFNYPSSDPFGNPVTQSASVVVGDEIMDDRLILGTVLYNHFTVYHKDQCPTHGDVTIPLKIVGTKMIAVAADYYGFGETGDKNQAYCIPTANGAASVDALIAASELLKDKGYTIGDMLFNMGYSEGGQTSIAVLRYCAQHHPEIKFTHTIAGGGPYDIGETYRQLILAEKTAMPSTVISTLLAYNEYRNLGYKKSELFVEPTLSKIDKYLLSKEYKQGEIETNVATEYIKDWVVPDLLDFSSDISKRFMSTFEGDDLTRNWKPDLTWRITLTHNMKDAAVPVANCQKMADFLKSQGFTITTNTTEMFNDGTVYTNYCDVNPVSLGPLQIIGAHELGALYFVAEINKTLSHYLGTPFYVKLTLEDLKSL